MPSKKNSRRAIYVNGRTIFIAGVYHENWHKTAVKQLYGAKPVTGVSQVTLTFYPSTKRRSDLTNKAESVMDLLVDCGVLADDNWFEVPEINLKFGAVDKGNPRVEIIIL